MWWEIIISDPLGCAAVIAGVMVGVMLLDGGVE